MDDQDIRKEGSAEGEAASERERQLSGALAEFADLGIEGEPEDIESFCSRYPHLQPELRSALETMRSLDRLMLSEDPDQPVPENAPRPEMMSGHRILSELGAGGMARVFLAVDERLGRKVAIKMLNERYSSHELVRTRFLREARALARLNHPHIVRIFHLGQADEPPHFIMEHIEGVQLLEAMRPLDLRLKVRLMQKIVLAAHFLHQHQIVHRDLKPGNILVGADLEPKLLDFGLARYDEDSGKPLSMDGEVMGTPQYFSPEQARGRTVLDARSDIFSLGIILYEVITGSLPFRGDGLRAKVKSICEEEPPLPRRLNSSIPGELQNICMKALEKNPSDRYATAREMADDLERFLAGEPVLAAPNSYAHRMSGKIDQHLRELEGWRQDRILADSEFDALRRAYDRLIEREDAWIMEVRRLSLPQVFLYFGVWILVVGAALLFLFRYGNLTGTAAVLVVAGAMVPTALYGIHCWRAGRLRIAVAFLLGACLLCPVTLLVAMGEYGFLTALTKGREDLEFFLMFSGFKATTNAQLWWALFLSLPGYLWLRRFTRSSVFSLVVAVTAALLCMVTLLRMGMLEWIEEDPGRIFLRLIPAALLFFMIAAALERLRFTSDSRYFYPVAVFFTYISLSGLAAFHDPYREWLERAAPWTRGQVDYLFLINAAIYFTLQWIFDRFRSPRMRAVAKAFRFVIPGHILVPLLLLGMEATRLWNADPASIVLQREARIFEVLLPAVACVLIFLSIPKQMKNYLGTGMLFLGIGIIRLQQNWLHDRVSWPIFLLAAGITLMFGAARFSAILAMLSRWFRLQR